MLSKLSKPGMIGPDLLLENNKLTVRDKKNDSGKLLLNKCVDAKGDGTYKFYFKTEN